MIKSKSPKGDETFFVTWPHLKPYITSTVINNIIDYRVQRVRVRACACRSRTRPTRTVRYERRGRSGPRSVALAASQGLMYVTVR